MNISLNILQNIADLLGAPEPALRLLLSVLIAYPLAFFYVKFLSCQSANVKHLFFASSGLGLCYFNYGTDTYHSLLAVVVTYFILQIFDGSKNGIIFAFTYHMGYLLGGYYLTETEDYDIKWTMPQCVLVLRLIGLVFDYSDGKQPPDSLSVENKKCALTKCPGLLEITAYTYFPSSFLVGPQFPLRRYQRFIAGELEGAPGSISYGFIRLGLGMLYLIMNQVGSIWIYNEYLLSSEFLQLSLFYKMLFIGIWGKLVLYKYISVWLISEGGCCCFGLSYSDTDKDWSGLENIRLIKFENAYKFSNYVEAFNVNTNWWVAQYVYKRLKFLGNRYISQASTLAFLAVWHGLHSGYYMTFFLEFVILYMEKEFEAIFNKNVKAVEFVHSPLLQPILWVIQKLYTVINMGFCLIPFVFVSFDIWWRVYWNVYLYGFILFLPWPLYKPIVKILLKPRHAKQG